MAGYSAEDLHLSLLCTLCVNKSQDTVSTPSGPNKLSAIWPLQSFSAPFRLIPALLIFPSASLSHCRFLFLSPLPLQATLWILSHLSQESTGFWLNSISLWVLQNFFLIFLHRLGPSLFVPSTFFRTHSSNANLSSKNHEMGLPKAWHCLTNHEILKK